MAMTKSQVYTALADKTGLSKKQVRAFLDDLAELAYQEAPNGFGIPGIGNQCLLNQAVVVGQAVDQLVDQAGDLLLLGRHFSWVLRVGAPASTAGICGRWRASSSGSGRTGARRRHPPP